MDRELTLENRFGLVINKEKTKVVNLGREGSKPDFPGFTFRYDKDLSRISSATESRCGKHFFFFCSSCDFYYTPFSRRKSKKTGHNSIYGVRKKYLNILPSDKSLKREKMKIKEMTRAIMCYNPVEVMIAELNRHLQGWKNYFDHGYPRRIFRKINAYVQLRLNRHLNRRSQRRYKKPCDIMYYQYLRKLEIILLCFWFVWFINIE